MQKTHNDITKHEYKAAISLMRQMAFNDADMGTTKMYAIKYAKSIIGYPLMLEWFYASDEQAIAMKKMINHLLGFYNNHPSRIDDIPF